MTSRHHQRRPVLNPEGWPLLRRWASNAVRSPRFIMWVLGIIAIMSLAGTMLVIVADGGFDQPAGLLLFAAINAGWSWMYMAVRLT